MQVAHLWSLFLAAVKFLAAGWWLRLLWCGAGTGSAARLALRGGASSLAGRPSTGVDWDSFLRCSACRHTDNIVTRSEMQRLQKSGLHQTIALVRFVKP